MSDEQQRLATSLLSELDSLDLARFRIVGGYTRYSDAVRNVLADAKQRILAGLDSPSKKRENHLIWAAPGSGKTFFVQQIAATHPGDVRFVELNLARCDESEMRDGLRSLLEHDGGPQLCLIDEVDAKPHAPWPYELLLPFLDANVEQGAHIVFAMAGSSGASIDELKSGIAGRAKGADLLSRTPAGNEFVIPPIELGDQLIVAAAQLQRVGVERSRPVASVEKMALYYIALTPHLANARQLTEFAARAVERMPPGEQRIKYDHLFEPGDAENKRFWLTASETNPSFVATYVTFPGDSEAADAKAGPIGDMLSASVDDSSEREASSGAERELTLPDKPSIAVLAFENMSGDPDQEYFADGIAEDIITALSKFRWFFVIARNSSFTFKGTSVDVTQVARELGVRFVLEGSVRKAGSRVRINAQLIEGATGNHVWAERYDRELADIFDLQDEMTETIVGAIEPELASAARARARQKPPDNLDAWDHHQRALWHLWKFTRDDANEAEAHFRSAIALDSGLGPAHAGLAMLLHYKMLFDISDSPDQDLQEASLAGQRAVAADNRDPFAHFALGRVQTALGDSDSAVAGLEKAVELNPNFSLAYYGLATALVYAGRAQEAVPYAHRAIRQSPHDPAMWAFENVAGVAHFVLREYDEAVAWLRRATRHPAHGYWADLNLAATFAERDELDQARAAMEAALRLKPGVSVSSVSSVYRSVPSDPKDRILDALLRIGLPEGPTAT